MIFVFIVIIIIVIAAIVIIMFRMRSNGGLPEIPLARLAQYLYPMLLR